MSAGGDLLTARELVERLAQLGVATWTRDVVRQWIREEPPCPIAAPGEGGAPHRYRLADVLRWLHARAAAERAKGSTRADGTTLLERISAAVSRLTQPAPPADDVPFPAAPLPPIADPAPLAAPAVAAPVSQAKSHFTAAEVDSATEVDLLMRVLEGRDPRNWKAAEEALRIRNQRLQDQRRWVPVDEMQRALDAEAVSIASAINAARAPLKLHLRDCRTDAERDRAVEEALDLVLARLSSADDLSGGDENGQYTTESLA